jgi:DNA-binding NtrC family response regulator
VSRLSQHIFVVDDEVMITESLALILSRAGFTVSSFTNPLEALQRVEIARPDLLISDVMMPQLSGIDLAIQIREVHPECRVLLLSGQAATLDLLHAARKRGHDFLLLQKPVHPNDLLLEIESLNASSFPVM